jgi:hypothetical protein
MVSDTDPSGYNITGPSAVLGTITIAPAVTSNLVTVNLAIGGTVSVDVNIDSTPILDVMLFADQIVDVNVYLRASDTDTFRLLDGTVQGVGVANVMKQPIRGLRLAGAQARVEFVNNSGVALTVFSALATFRGI